MKKISILMPTYNGGDTIIETLDSVMKQDYDNFEVLICDDGSTDDTKNIIKKYKKLNDKKDLIKYFYQDNADQLNALINLIPHITGDYVYILHSDDLLSDGNVLGKMINYMEENVDVDAITADIEIINNDSNVVGIQKVSKYKNKKNTIALQLLWLGRNLYVDFAFHRRKVFLEKVYNNYLLWNGPFWLDIDNNNMLNVKNVDFSFLKYRVFEGNYLNNDGAKLNVINGEIRVVTRLLSNYYIPFYKLQYIIYRIFNKLKIKYIPIYINKETKNKYEIVKFVLNKRFTDKEISENMFLNSLLLFYKNNNKRSIKLHLKDSVIYYGKDMRVFNKKLNDKTIDKFYINFLNEMAIGFDEIIVKNSEEQGKVRDLTRFLCIYPYVKIKIGGDKFEDK